MSFLRPIAVLIRDALLRQHPYVPCCAACGEIKTPGANRLCSSLECSFTVDAVVSADAIDARHETMLRRRAEAFEAHWPWLRRIFVVSREEPGFAAALPKRMRLVPSRLFMPEDARWGPEAYLHLMPELGDYYLIVDLEQIPSRKQHPLDFFTVNGLPLLRLEKDRDGRVKEPWSIKTDCMPQTRENAAAFLQSGETPAAAEECAARSEAYREAAGRWAFRCARAVPMAAME